MAITVVDRSVWNPSRAALWSQRWGAANDPNQPYPTVVLLRHPTAPFLGSLDEITDKKIQAIAFDYLDQASKLTQIDLPLELPGGWLAALDPRGGHSTDYAPSFGWMPIKWPLTDTNPDATPLASFQAKRYGPGGSSELPDQTIIVLATPSVGNQGLGSEFGIRVVAHAWLNEQGTYNIRITGMSASLPFGPYRLRGRQMGILSESGGVKLFLSRFLSPQITDPMAAKLGFDSIHIRGLRLAPIGDDDFQVEWRGTGTMAGSRAEATPHSFVFAGTLKGGPEDLISKVELVADAWPPTKGYARLFNRDPASQPDVGSQGGPGKVHTRRPTRSEHELDEFRCEEEVTTGQNVPLEFPPPAQAAAFEDLMVMPCPGFVLEDLPGNNLPKQVNLPDTGPDTPYIRSNDFAAINAYKNVEQLFNRLDAYGIGIYQYFRFTNLPLKLFYRSGIRPGPGKDGQTVNARVLVEGYPVDFEGPIAPGDRPYLEMHFALADLSTRARKPWNGTDRSQAQPLGIAADARWVWHEIGHVLLATSVGELQFRFAHSPGDALAAIVADPRSTLATDANWRGATFPWVFLPRRHDRCVSHGWGWGGQLHYKSSQVPYSQVPRRKAYWTEQILSSSLFRLYRCIGGDTTLVGSQEKDVYACDSASHYSVYLIMRAIQLLGPPDIVPAYEPDQFVSALIDADTGTGPWNVSFIREYCADNPPNDIDLEFERVGGCVHKVIRWAFEAQGLYTAAGRITNAPGVPPLVDIYIGNYRPAMNQAIGGIQYGQGSYFPVSLDWNPNQSELTDPPAWQATPAAINVAGDDINVTVGNRGGQPANNVEVSVWWHEWPANTLPPDWDPANWTECDATGVADQIIAPGVEAPFGPFTHNPPADRYIVLAIATSADDFANTDPSTMLPCSLQPTPLLDLAANDNNLGLRVIGNPV